MNRKTLSILAIVIVGGTIMGMLVVAWATTSVLPCLFCGPDPSHYEKLQLVSYRLNSATNITLVLKNNFSFAWSLVKYSVSDSNGNQYSSGSWTSPSVPSTGLGTEIITIGSSCAGCSYQGSPGAFDTFNLSKTYTVTVLTVRNNQFTFLVST
jgi:hypothetical protein